jgi:hypothetical protein
MEPKKIVDIIGKNLDEIVQPIVVAILLLGFLSKKSAEENQISPLIKIIENQLDEMLDLIGYIYQTTWFNLEIMGNTKVLSSFFENTS